MEYRRSQMMFCWSLLTGGLIALFWMMYYFVNGPVPVVSALKWSDAQAIALPFSVPRWFDVLIGPIYTIIFVSLFTPSRVKKYEDAGIGLVFGLVFGLVIGLRAILIFGLGASLGFGLVASLVIGLVASLVDGVSAGLVFGLVSSLVIGLVIGLGAGLVIGLGAGLVIGLGAVLGASLGFGLEILFRTFTRRF